MFTQFQPGIPTQLSAVQRTLVLSLLEQMLSTTGGESALKFRADHYDHVKDLESLEAGRLLRCDNDRYRVSALALGLLDDEPAPRLLSHIERLYAALRVRYRQAQRTQVLVSSLAADVGLSVAEVSTALRLMLDVPMWHAGHSNELLKEDDYILPAEAILKYENFAAAVEEVRRWNTVRPEVGSVPLPARRAAMGETRRPEDLRRAWPAARACLQEFSFYDIKEVAGLAGFDVTAAAHLVQKYQGGASKGQLMTAVDEQVAQMDDAARRQFLTILIEEILRRHPHSEEKLAEYLSRLGWSFVNGTLVPTEMFDVDVLSDTPDEAHHDLVKAAQRMRDGDLGGAISAACGAVDAATSKVYEEFDLGDPTKASFQERCKKAALAKGVLTKLDRQLEGLGWSDVDVVPFKKNLEGALNQGAYVMQTLRSHMGDVHGTKPILRALAFDCLRWAELIVGSLVDRAE